MDLNLGGRVAVVTGAGSGIGLATCRRLVQEGAIVVGADVAPDAVSELGPKDRILAVKVDLGTEEGPAATIERAKQAFGGVDILINNAGITQPIRIMGIQPQNYDAVLDANLRGMLYLSQAFIPHMISRGRVSIASTSSVSALTGGGFFGGPHYSAAKAGMLGLTKDMARELAPKGIRVNAVAPGPVWTPLIPSTMPAEAFRKFGSNTPMKRPGQPEEVAVGQVQLRFIERLRRAEHLLAERAQEIEGALDLVDVLAHLLHFLAPVLLLDRGEREERKNATDGKRTDQEAHGRSTLTELQ